MKYAILILLVLAMPLAYAYECNADSVVEYTPGPAYNGGEIAPERMNPDNALGIPQNDDTLNFVSLGFGGLLILDFGPNAIVNGEGMDLQVVETSFNNPPCIDYPEHVHVYASNDMNDWEDLGTGCLDSEFDLGNLDTARYVKLVDESREEEFGGGDGYDVDGLTAPLCRETEIPEFGLMAGMIAMIGALGGFLILRKK